MIGKKQISSKYATLPEVKEIMEKRSKEGELGFEQQAALEYGTKFSKSTPEKAAKLVAELLKTGKVKEGAAVKIADLLPDTADKLRLVLSKERYSLEKNEIEELLKIIEENR